MPKVYAVIVCPIKREKTNTRYGILNEKDNHIGIIRLGTIAIGRTSITFLSVICLSRQMVLVDTTPAISPKHPLTISPPNIMLESIFAMPSGKHKNSKVYAKPYNPVAKRI